MANEPTPIELGKDEDNKELDNIDGNDEGPEDEDIEEDEDVEDVEELDEDEDVDVPVIEEDVVEVEDYEEPLVAGADDEDDNDEEDDDEEDDDDEDDDDEEDETYIDPSLGEDIDLYNEYDEYMDPNYLQKFNESNEKMFLEEVHHEKKFHNYAEIMLLAVVERDENNIIIDDLHKTIPILTKYELTKVLGQRIKQLNAGAKPFVENISGILDNYFIAKTELEKKKIPFIIRRPLPNKTSEYWNLKDLEILTS